MVTLGPSVCQLFVCSPDRGSVDPEPHQADVRPLLPGGAGAQHGCVSLGMHTQDAASPFCLQWPPKCKPLSSSVLCRLRADGTHWRS